MVLRSSLAKRPLPNSRNGTPRSKFPTRPGPEASPYIRGKSAKGTTSHRPSNSYGGTTAVDHILKDIEDHKKHETQKLSYSGKPKPSFAASILGHKKQISKETELAGSKRKSNDHRRAVSLADRPMTQGGRMGPEITHTRIYSLEKVKSHTIVDKFAYRTKTGYIPGNPNKVNQDSLIAQVNFTGHAQMYLFSVCDGHGLYGREVSSSVKQWMPEILANDSALLTNPRRSLTTATLLCHQKLSRCNIDCNFSGTTMTLVFIKELTLWCANVGDSRSLIARQVKPTDSKSSGRHWMSIALSRDHKPDDRDESARILAQGGRIEAYQDEQGNPLGPARVWLQDQDIPGLAMSRSLGDLVASSVGVSCEPEILEFALTSEDKFIVLGSDGIFEFLSNEDVVKIVVPFWKLDDPVGAADMLMKEAHARWCTEEEVVDDITCIVIFLDIP